LGMRGGKATVRGQTAKTGRRLKVTGGAKSRANVRLVF
jgi:hypothetical protein